MVGLNPGDLREVVSFKEKVLVSDGAGGGDATYALAFKTFAKVTLDKPARSIEAGQMVNITTRKVIIRYSETRQVEQDMRMEWQGKDYLIVSIDEVDMTKMLVAITVTRSA